METTTIDLISMIGQYGFILVALVLILRGDIVPRKSVEELKEVFALNTELLAKRLLEGMEATIQKAVANGVRDGLEELVHRRIVVSEDRDLGDQKNTKE